MSLMASRAALALLALSLATLVTGDSTDATCSYDADALSSPPALLQTHRKHSKGASGSRLASGMMTMWSDSRTTIVGGSCEYANAANGGVNSPAATSPYVGRKFYCAADAWLYAGGASCGQCFRVSYDGSPATDPGRPGEAIVQIVDSGSAKTFDCHVDAFETVTGARTGVFPVKYEPVPCDVASTGGVVTILDGLNAWYTKVIFSNLPGPVLSAELAIGGVTRAMQRVGGATWKASLWGATGAIEFRAKIEGGTVAFGECFSGNWPVPTGASCSTVVRSPEPEPEPEPETTVAATTTTATSTITLPGLQSGDIIYLKAHTGKRVTVQGEDVHAKWDHQGSWQALVIEKDGGGAISVGDTVFLKAHTGKYISVWGDDVVAKWENRLSWEALVVESNTSGLVQPGMTVRLRAHTGKRVTVQGTLVHAKWDHRGSWQAFTVEVKV